MAIDLGFVKKCESWRLESRFFPSKVGGKPAWLGLTNIPGKNDLECEYCGDPCVFLCQVYAPYSDPDTFHRTVYIFICKNVDCCRPNQNGNLRVFRSQLARCNTFYSSEPPVEQNDRSKDVGNVSKWTKTCRICGIWASSHCSKCKVINYCCRAHQVYDWKNGHKDRCGTDTDNRDTDFLFPEHEIVIDNDIPADENIESIDDSQSEQEELEKYNKMIRDGKAGTLRREDINDDLLQMASDEKDEVFAEFRMEIDEYPDQILRYDRGGKILYISSHNQIENVPNCSECNGDRQFEFQIMPQLLNFLDLKDVKCLDWGILAVFTCKRSCPTNGKYVRECIFKQDIVQEINSESESQINQNI